MTPFQSYARLDNAARPPFAGRLYALATLTAALTAAAAAGTSMMLSIPPWAMFIGWVAYFTRKPSPVEGLWSFACLAIGLTIGAIATLATGAVAPTLGSFALPAVVFIVAVTVISMRGFPIMNNLLAYFLGLISFFAAHLPPMPSTLLQLAGAAALGLFAGWLSQAIERTLRGWASH